MEIKHSLAYEIVLGPSDFVQVVKDAISRLEREKGVKPSRITIATVSNYLGIPIEYKNENDNNSHPR